MKISETPENDIVVGMRIKSLRSDLQGTIIRIDLEDDRYSWIQWDNQDKSYGGFYWNHCECEIVK